MGPRRWIWLTRGPLCCDSPFGRQTNTWGAYIYQGSGYLCVFFHEEKEAMFDSAKTRVPVGICLHTCRKLVWVWHGCVCQGRSATAQPLPRFARLGSLCPGGAFGPIYASKTPKESETDPGRKGSAKLGHLWCGNQRRSSSSW